MDQNSKRENNRLVIVIASEFHSRSFFSGDLFEKLNANFELQFLVNEEVTTENYPSEIRIYKFKVEIAAIKMFPNVLDSSLIRNINRSSSFKFRLRRYLLGDYRKTIPLSLTGVIRLMTSLFNALPIRYRYQQSRYFKVCQFSPDLVRNVKNYDPKFVICWSQSIEPAVVMSMNLAIETKSKSILVFDNWDNLSSKTILLKKPDYVVCFGNQSKDFAIRIHGLDELKVFGLGSARFDAHSKVDIDNVSSKRNSIMIAGSSLAMEDSYVLKCISEILKSTPKDHPIHNYQFVYRPHPQPQGLSLKLQSWPYKFIKIDSSTPNSSLWQSQNEIQDFLIQQRIVIASPTTLILEAALNGCKVIIPTFKTKGVLTNNRLMLAKLEHLQILNSIKEISRARNCEELRLLLLEGLNSEFKPLSKALVREIVCIEPGDFASRFTDMLLEVTKA